MQKRSPKSHLVIIRKYIRIYIVTFFLSHFLFFISLLTFNFISILLASFSLLRTDLSQFLMAYQILLDIYCQRLPCARIVVEQIVALLFFNIAGNMEVFMPFPRVSVQK